MNAYSHYWQLNDLAKVPSIIMIHARMTVSTCIVTGNEDTVCM